MLGSIALIIVLGVGLVLWVKVEMNKEPLDPVAKENDFSISDEVGMEAKDDEGENNLPDIEVIATGLEIPWDIAFLPNGEMLVTERLGRLVNITTGKEIKVSGIHHVGEGGLLGMVLHPNFEQNNFIYLYHTVKTGDSVENTVVRYMYEGDTLTEDKVILSGIPSAIYHDGGRMEFGPDGKLWITVGDATSPEGAQDPGTLLGTLLRLNDDGTPAPNTMPSGVYSYGHRNAQGLAWDDAGNLWSTEHGRTSATLTGMDEVNLIVGGGNYGWPEIEGDEERVGMISPSAHSGPDVTWAPASAVYWNGSIFFGGLKGEAIYEAVLDGASVREVKTHMKGEYGRIRTIRLGPDGMFYVTTSNRDGRGTPVAQDDRIIRMNPEIFRN